VPIDDVDEPVDEDPIDDVDDDDELPVLSMIDGCASVDCISVV
jgi:hypothetical protein